MYLFFVVFRNDKGMFINVIFFKNVLNLVDFYFLDLDKYDLIFI